MKLQVVGCSHHASSIAVREQLAFSPEQTRAALDAWRQTFPTTEAVLLSTCNRVEFYTASEEEIDGPTHEQVAQFLAEFHKLRASDVIDQLIERTGEDAVRHLFTVAASLDSMVIGEPQILSQVKQAYQVATELESTGPLTHGIFQAAVRVARRVATETTIYQRRVSIPSVAIGDFASQIFETFDDKQVLVIGAGEMGAETVRYLREAGAQHITVINRDLARAQQLAAEWNGQAAPWTSLHAELIAADLVISTTGATEPIVTLDAYRQHVNAQRFQRPLFILDLATPRDFDARIGADSDCLGVYLYSTDDLAQACAKNRLERDQELPAALLIIEAETELYMADLFHRSTAPIIKRLRQGWHEPKEQELKRLLNRLPELDERAQREIAQAFDRLVNKLLHPPLESLRDAARSGPPHGLLEALKRLFQID